MSFVLFAWAGALRQPNSERTFSVYTKLSNDLVGSIVLCNTYDNLDWLAAELHRRVYLCASRKVHQENKDVLPSKFLTVFVGQVELKKCKTAELSCLSQQRISFMWDCARHANTSKYYLEQTTLGATHLEAHRGLTQDIVEVSENIRTLHFKNVSFDAQTLVGAHKLCCLQEVSITQSWINIHEEAAPLAAQLPRHLTKLVVSMLKQTSRLVKKRINQRQRLLLRQIHKCVRLKHLNLSVSMDCITDKLGEMTSLVHLDLSCNNLFSLPSLKRLVNLEELDLHNNTQLGGSLDLPCAKLTRLNISFCDFGPAVLDDLRACSTLKQVDLYGNTSLHGLGQK